MRISIVKGRGHSEKSGKDYDYYALCIGELYEHRFFATSKLESAYLDKAISQLAHEGFKAGKTDSHDLDDLDADAEKQLEKDLDELDF